MVMLLSKVEKAYLAGFLDGDGSIYVRAKPNSDYRFGFQIAPYIILFQSAKGKENFQQLCKLIGFGYMRDRKDGVLEYTINKISDIRVFLTAIYPYTILKQKQIELMLKILDAKEKIETESDFKNLLELVDSYRDLNYSKKRINRVLTP
jgi:hypothetical protein